MQRWRTLSVGLTLAIAASLVHASTDAAKKALTRRLDSLAALTGFVLYGLPLAALAWWVGGLVGAPVLGVSLSGEPRAGFYGYAALSVVFNLAANGLFFEAVRRSPLSLTLPFLSFTPVFLIGTSFLINHELPSALGVVGVALIVVGALLLHAGELRHGISGPLRAIVGETGSLMMLAVSAIWSVSGAADKAAITRSGPLTYLLAWHVGCGVPLLAVAAAYRRLGAVAAQALPASGTAALHVLAVSLQFLALPRLQVAYVIAIKRAGMLVGILYGRLFFGEARLAQRLLGASVMVAGVLCIVLGVP